jgi:hypothetical protein
MWRAVPKSGALRLVVGAFGIVGARKEDNKNSETGGICVF